MSRSIVWLVIGCVAVGSGLSTKAAPMEQAQSPVKMQAAKDVSPTDGAGMFRSYCAPCHGADAKGNGPAAKALNPKPANLTEFAKRRGGTFSAKDFEDKLQGMAMAAAHGNTEMPVWGPVFRQLGNEPIRIANIRTYLESLQVK